MIWPEKPLFIEGCSCFRFNNLELALGTNLKFYTSVAKGLILKVRKFCRSYRRKTGRGGLFAPPPSWIRLISKTTRHSKTVLQQLKNLQNTLKIQIQDIERKTLFQNDEFNIYPDECFSNIQYTDTLKKLKYITAIQRLITIFWQRFQVLLDNHLQVMFNLSREKQFCNETGQQRIASRNLFCKTLI